ncbi:otoancorin-like isoform X2 [Antedon mediterranea]|uniref:otoancorin-like isoform X2 n=1 Tax=Antedon mediterranea TaxID=105859 RepID=UPI003AF9D66D
MNSCFFMRLVVSLCMLSESTVVALSRKHLKLVGPDPSCPEQPDVQQMFTDDHRWHVPIDEKGTGEKGTGERVTDNELHCMFGSLYEDDTGDEDMNHRPNNVPNIADIMIKNKMHHQETRHNSTQRKMNFKEAYIPNSLLKRLSSDYVANLTVAEVKVMLESTDFSIDSFQHIFSNVNRTVFERLMMDVASDDSDIDIPKMYYHPMIDAGINQMGPIDTWNPQQAETMRPFLQGLSNEHIKELQSDTFQSLLPSLNELSDKGALDKSVQTVVMQKYKESKGPVQRWTADDMDEVNALLPTLSRRDIMAIPNQVIDESLNVIDTKVIAKNAQIARAYVHRVTDLSTWMWSAENVTRLGDLVQFIQSQDMKNLPASVITMDVFTSTVRKRGKESRLIAKKVVEQRGDPSAWSSEDLRSIGKSVVGLEMQELEKIPAEAILGAVDDLDASSMSPRQKQTLLKKVKRQDSGRISAAEIKDLKGLSSMLKTDDLKELDPNDVLEAAETFKGIGKDLNKAKRKQIVQKASKVEGDVGALIGMLGEDYVAEIPLKSVKKMSFEDITSMSVSTGNNQSSGAGEVKWTRSQSKSLYRSIKSGLEEMEGEEVTFTTDIIRNLGTIASGLPCEDIHKMAGDDVVSLVTALMEQDGWDNKQMRCIKDTMMESDEEFTSRLTESDITNLGGRVLKEFSVDDLNQIPENLKKLAYEQIGNTKLTEDKKEKRKWMASEALKIMNKSSDEVLTSDDLLSLGNLSCSVPADAYTRIEPDAFIDNVYSLRECYLDKEQLGAIHDKLMDVNGELNTWSSDAIATSGPLLSSFSRNEILEFDEANFSAVAIETLNSFKEFRDRRSGSIIDVTEEDQLIWTEGFTSVAIRTKEALVAESEGSRRRRRDVVHSPSCDEIIDLQDGNIAWTVDELDAITTDTFHNCFDVLGAVSNYSDGQLDILLNKAIQTWGSVSNISSEDIALLGYIATAFTPDHMSQLDLSYLDTLYTIGQLNGWQCEQLESGVNRYLELTGWQISDLNGTDLTGLSSFLCGMSLDQMLTISFESYGEASTNIGELTMCSHQQLSILKSKAVEQYGAIATWLPEIYTEVGTVVGGFSSQDFANIDEESLAGISPAALALLPPDVFKDSFNLELVGYFDQYQAQAITNDQRSVLSSSVQDALYAAEYGGDVTILSQVRTDKPTSSSDSTKYKLLEWICVFILMLINKLV